jgi:hypothetical protein
LVWVNRLILANFNREILFWQVLRAAMKSSLILMPDRNLENAGRPEFRQRPVKPIARLLNSQHAVRPQRYRLTRALFKSLTVNVHGQIIGIQPPGG